MADTISVLVIGGSYAGLSCIVNLLSSFDNHAAQETTYAPKLMVTLIDQRNGFFHTVGTPLAHVVETFTDPFWLEFRSIPQLCRPEVTIRRGTVSEMDPSAQSAAFIDYENGDSRVQITFDYAVVATGLRRDWPNAPRAFIKTEYVDDALGLISDLDTEQGVVIVGAGAVGVEVAAEAKHYYPHRNVILVHSRLEVLSNEPLPSEFKEKALECLRDIGVDVRLGQRAAVGPKQSNYQRVTLTNGTVINAGAVIVAGSRWVPNSKFLPSILLSDSGYVKVTKHLRIPSARHCYAIGDVAEWSGIRRAGGALAMGSCAAANLLASIYSKTSSVAPTETQSTGPFKEEEFPELTPMMALAVGPHGVSYSPAEGVRCGSEVMQRMFGQDLGWSTCLHYLGLATSRAVM